MAKGKYETWLTEDGRMMLQAWARDGYSNAELAQKMGIAEGTLYEWLKTYPEIKEALSRGKEPYDIEVENKMHDLCLGYVVPLKKPFKLRKVEYDPDTGKKVREYDVIETAIEEEYVPPNVIAQKYWLSNRKPESWREKREEKIDIDGPETGVLMLAPVMEDEDAGGQ